MFDTKISMIIRDDLATWQKLNVTAFLFLHLTRCLLSNALSMTGLLPALAAACAGRWHFGYIDRSWPITRRHWDGIAGMRHACRPACRSSPS